MNKDDEIIGFKFPRTQQEENSHEENEKRGLSFDHSREAYFDERKEKLLSPKKSNSYTKRLNKGPSSSRFSLGETPFEKNHVKKQLTNWSTKNESSRATPAIHSWENSSSQQTVQSRLDNFKKTPYQVSRYRPAKNLEPLIPDVKTEIVSDDELLKSMKKKKTSYLLFSKNNWKQEESLQAPVEDDIIPKSLVEEDIETPALLKKDEKEKKRRSKSALDKTLKGIFEGEQASFFDRYFE